VVITIEVRQNRAAIDATRVATDRRESGDTAMSSAFATDALAGQRALVTGGARGIGEGIARQLAQMGAHVEIADLDLDTAKSTADDIVAGGGLATARAIDLADHDGLAAFCEDVDPLDILVNNAAPRVPNGPFMDVPIEEWQFQFSILMWAPLILIRDLGRRMAGRGHGAIVNIIATGAQRPAPFTAAYAAAKAAMEAISKVTALELGLHGVRSNGIAPTFVPTERNRPLREQVGYSENSSRSNPIGQGSLRDCSRCAHSVSSLGLAADP
jgi:3-hydroxybutyrate dehydrogenase